MPGGIQQASQLYKTLKAEFTSPSPDLNKCGSYLAKLKISLSEMQLLLPGEATNADEILIAREILEIGAYWSVHVKDIPCFERYIAQLNTYYTDYSSLLPPSDKMYPLTGLNLLRLLSQNRIAEFHTALENIEPEQLLENPFIKHPVHLEQYLMEGSYKKVWNAREQVPAPEYLFFIDILMGTIRSEIASCSEKAYSSLPLLDAATLLFFNNLNDVMNFAVERGWNVNPAEQKIYFTTKDDNQVEIPHANIIRQALNYARELEQIV
ncbi:26s proteasome non-atpase regulatory subunit 8 [Gigaspora margarita]|uniref:26s proteasome non-atpase regulatory subunit 8 n=1 Tax=Gigaspora margarita TaxID=4874 RepID=A0A8H4A4F8_GIGMA|nr:26s proteasome non-atpase regulatory subunit 8 [Gigaspora margarita]